MVVQLDDQHYKWTEFCIIEHDIETAYHAGSYSENLKLKRSSYKSHRFMDVRCMMYHRFTVQMIQ